MQDFTPADQAAHFVPLRVIMADYGGKLADYMKANAARNVVVTMDIEMQVSGKTKEGFFVAVAVTLDFESPEALSDEATRQSPAGYRCLFAWVPANLYGGAEFGILIDEIGVGEKLQNGLVAEIIDKAEIEAAVVALASGQAG